MEQLAEGFHVQVNFKKRIKPIGIIIIQALDYAEGLVVIDEAGIRQGHGLKLLVPAGALYFLVQRHNIPGQDGGVVGIYLVGHGVQDILIRREGAFEKGIICLHKIEGCTEPAGQGFIEAPVGVEGIR
ncbi:hypothetical protein D3C81_1742660 [compost metagenome]